MQEPLQRAGGKTSAQNQQAAHLPSEKGAEFPDKPRPTFDSPVQLPRPLQSNASPKDHILSDYMLLRPNSYYPRHRRRSEEHTSELQSQFHLVCRLLLEKT